MLDFDLAMLYGVETKRLKEQVKRNLLRFPKDFMFELNKKEVELLRSQNATFSSQVFNYLPLAFTEQGIAMLSSVLNSEQAIAVNIQIVRLFTQMRKTLMENKDIMLKLETLENKILAQNDRVGNLEKEVQIIFKALRELLLPEKKERNKIGF